MNPAQIAIVVLVLICIIYGFWVDSLRCKLKMAKTALQTEYNERERQATRAIYAENDLSKAKAEIFCLMQTENVLKACVDQLKTKAKDDAGYIKHLEEELELAREMKATQPFVLFKENLAKEREGIVQDFQNQTKLLSSTLSVGQPTAEELARFKI